MISTYLNLHFGSKAAAIFYSVLPQTTKFSEEGFALANL